SVQRFNVSHLYISASQASALASVDYQRQYNLNSLEVIKYGGSKVASNLLLAIKQKYGACMHEYYGSTEFYGHVMTRTRDEMYDNFEPGNLGTVLPSVEMKVVDVQTNRALPPGQNG